MLKGIVILCLILNALMGIGQSNSIDDFKIDYGFSFGECIGFCEKTKTLSSAGIISISKRYREIARYSAARVWEEKVHSPLITMDD